jgi:hypothetical protein
LSWWKASESTYPRLAQVAKDVFAVQIAQVGVERVFNLAKDVIGDRRHRMSAQTLQKVMMIKHHILEDGSTVCKKSSEEQELHLDEEDDLLELAANAEALSENNITLDRVSSEEEPQTPSRRLRNLPRKRARPSRYRGDTT